MPTRARILAATDFSRPAQLAVARAARLAAAAGTRLDIVHVARPLGRPLLAWLRSQPEARTAAEDEVQARLDAAVELAAEHGAAARAHLVSGAPVVALDAIVRRLGADLVVVGARGARGFRDQLIGTTAEQLIERLSCDVLVVRKSARHYRRILVGVDTSAASAHTLRRAVELGPRAEIHVVHAYEPPLESMLRNAHLKHLLTEHVRAEQRRARQQIEALLRDAEIADDRVTLALRRGYPPHVLERAASQLAPDLLAVGHHTSPLAQPFLGSVARHMMRISGGDVLIAHP